MRNDLRRLQLSAKPQAVQRKSLKASQLRYSTRPHASMATMSTNLLTPPKGIFIKKSRRNRTSNPPEIPIDAQHSHFSIDSPFTAHIALRFRSPVHFGTLRVSPVRPAKTTLL